MVAIIYCAVGNLIWPSASHRFFFYQPSRDGQLQVVAGKINGGEMPKASNNPTFVCIRIVHAYTILLYKYANGHAHGFNDKISCAPAAAVSISERGIYYIERRAKKKKKKSDHWWIRDGNIGFGKKFAFASRPDGKSIRVGGVGGKKCSKKQFL